jgi:hypothetical protein
MILLITIRYDRDIKIVFTYSNTSPQELDRNAPFRKGKLTIVYYWRFTG